MNGFFIALSVFLSIILCLVVIFLLWLFLFAPRKKRSATDAFLAIKFAHRGLHDKTKAENSLSAFRSAIEHGYSIELDVRLSKDGIPVVFHDATLERLCGKSLCVSDCTAEELATFSLNGTPDTIPTLADVLKEVNGKARLLIEIKDDKEKILLAEKTAEVLKSYPFPYAIQSFEPRILAYFKKYHPATLRGQLSTKFTHNKIYRKFRYVLAQNLLVNFIGRPDFIAYNFRDRDVFSLRLMQKLFKGRTIVWTIHSLEEEMACSAFESIIFEGYLSETTFTTPIQ